MPQTGRSAPTALLRRWAVENPHALHMLSRRLRVPNMARVIGELILQTMKHLSATCSRIGEDSFVYTVFGYSLRDSQHNAGQIRVAIDRVDSFQWLGLCADRSWE
jgi:hypothetical protein